MAGQPTTLNSMVCLPLAGACCRRFRVAWQSSEQLAACKLQVVARYFRCYLIFGRCHASCPLQTRRVSVSVAFLFRLSAPSTRFFALLVTTLSHLASTRFPIDAFRLAALLAPLCILDDGLHWFTSPRWLPSFITAVGCKPMVQLSCLMMDVVVQRSFRRWVAVAAPLRHCFLAWRSMQRERD